MFDTTSLEASLRGSQVNFKERQRLELSEAEDKLNQLNNTKLQKGIILLRKLRTHALANEEERQPALREARDLASRMAQVILGQAYLERPSEIESSFLDSLLRINDKYLNVDAGSGHGIPPSYPVRTLTQAAGDMFVRVGEKAGSIYSPDHKLSQEEMDYVLKEFLLGTNDLTINARKVIFSPDTKVGGILSGGSVYLEMIRQLTDKYADPSLKIDSFTVAVDVERDKAVFEKSHIDDKVKTVVLTDEWIDKGSTILTALWKIGEQFPNARIYSGLGTDSAGGFKERRDEKHMGYLFGLFQDFADLCENGKKSEAKEIFQQADTYAKSNRVELQRGWYLRKEQLDVD